MTHPLSDSLERQPPRPLPVALAHYIVATKPGERSRVDTMHRLYRAMNAREKILTRLEMKAAKAGKRGELQADVS